MVDVASSAGALAPKNLCDAEGSNQWTYTVITSSDPTYTAKSAARVLTYAELDGPCALSSTFNSTTGTRSGVVGLFYSRKLASGNYQVLRAWQFPLQLHFPLSTHAFYSGSVLGAEPELVQDAVVYTGAFDTQFLLYENNFFDNRKEHAFYRAGDRAFAELKITSGAQVIELSLALDMAWLSKTTNPKSPSLHNLTQSVTRLSGEKGRVRFSVELVACINCYLHVLASISSRRLSEQPGRQLMVGTHHALQMTPINVEMAGVDEEDVPEPGTGLPITLLVVALASVLVCCPLLAACCFMRRKQAPAGAPLDVIPAPPPVPPPMPLGLPATTEPVFQMAPAAVAQLLAAELRKATGLGVGYDQRCKKANYSALALCYCWSINVPTRAMGYQVRKMEIQADTSRVVAAFFRGNIPRVSTSTNDVTNGLRHATGLDDTCNETMLFHGTDMQNVIDIAYTGVSERLSGGLFGHGAYLAEDAAKADQYASPLETSSTDPAAKGLRSRLFEECGLLAPGEDLYFMLVCKVVLGFPVYTTDGETAMRSPPTDTRISAGAKVFANNERRELTTVKGISPSVRYHSLIAEKDRLVKRFREFIVFDGRAILPAYIVAYTRR